MPTSVVVSFSLARAGRSLPTAQSDVHTGLLVEHMQAIHVEFHTHSITKMLGSLYVS